MRLTMWLGVAAIFIGIGYTSYQSGTLLARMEVSSLESEIARLNTQLENVRAENDRLRLDLSQSRSSAEGLRRRYDSDVPSGGLASLVALLRERQAAGVKDDRLAQVLRDAEPVRVCDGRMLRKRFGIQPAGQSVEEGVSFLDGLITVSASAPTSADDPAKAATVTIIRQWATQPIKLSGLPVRQTIAINNSELKLTVEASDIRGYGIATLSVCGRG